MAYWVQADDNRLMRLTRRQPTQMPGMFTRREVVDYYCLRTGRTVTGRTLDLGADKADNTGLALRDEPNPALGGKISGHGILVVHVLSRRSRRIASALQTGKRAASATA